MLKTLLSTFQNVDSNHYKLMLNVENISLKRKMFCTLVQFWCKEVYES